MTNNELQQIFQTAETDSENIFDIYDFLADYEEKYKEMKISKIKPTIYDAYELYCNHKNKVSDIITAIINADYSNLVNHFNFNDLINQIPEEFRPLLSQLIEENMDL
jgi:hypothetical protein